MNVENFMRERFGHILARVSDRFRMNYRVTPGLYPINSPTADSPLLASANYQLSFDVLQGSLGSKDAWILVLDTGGINVWCAAGKGKFGTYELTKRIRLHNLEQKLSHRKIIVPQLGAPGVDAARVQRESGFRVYYGPVQAKDLPAYLDAGMKASPQMRVVQFPTIERLKLVPLELIPAVKMYFYFSVLTLIFFGLQPQGILFSVAWRDGAPFLFLGLGSLLTGTLAVPALLPWIPFRSFVLKGWLLGFAAMGALIVFVQHEFYRDRFLLSAIFLLFPAISSYLALLFTGATTFTSPSGVKKEIDIALPFYRVAFWGALTLLLVFKLRNLGVL